MGQGGLLEVAPHPNFATNRMLYLTYSKPQGEKLSTTSLVRGRFENDRLSDVQPLFDGAVYIAIKAGVPIVPVGIGGSERVMPKGAKFIYPRKVRVIVGEPMHLPPAADPSPKAQREVRRCQFVRWRPMAVKAFVPELRGPSGNVCN